MTLNSIIYSGQHTSVFTLAHAYTKTPQLAAGMAGPDSVQFQPHTEFWLVLRSLRLKRNKALRGKMACKHVSYVPLRGKCSLQMKLVNEPYEKGSAGM